MKKNSQSGFTVIELALYAGMLAITLFAIGTAIVQVQGMKSNVEAVSDRDQAFMSAIQIVNSVKTVSALANGAGVPAGLKACLSGKGTGCQGYSNSVNDFETNWEPMNATMGPKGFCAGANDPSCTVQRKVTYQWNCQQSFRCQGVIFHIQVQGTAAVNGAIAKAAGRLGRREATIQVDYRIFNDVASLDINSCPDGISSIDYARREATCATITSAVDCAERIGSVSFTTSGGSPAADCVTPAAQASPTGFSSLNAFSGTSL